METGREFVLSLPRYISTLHEDHRYLMAPRCFGWVAAMIHEHERAKTVKAKPFGCSLKSARSLDSLDTSC